jgi:predicted Zn finger-like uncharacterized protein
MFTVCPKCALTLVVTAADLRVAQGYVRCGRCSSVFNALARLTDERSAAEAMGETQQAPRLPDEALPPAESPQAPAASAASGKAESPPAPAGLQSVPLADTAAAAAAPAAAEEEPIPEDALEFNPATTDVSAVFVAPPPDPEWTAATGTFKAMIAAKEPPAGELPARLTAPDSPEPPPPAAQASPEPPQRAAHASPDTASLAAAGAARVIYTRPPLARRSAPHPRPPLGADPATPHVPARPRAAAPPASEATTVPPADLTDTGTAVAEDTEGAWARLLPYLWRVGSGLAALVLLAQIVHHHRDELATSTRLNRPLSALYAALGMPLVPRWDLHAYDVRQLGASVDPAGAGLITVRASIKNAAPHPQPLPLLRVTLQDRFGNRIAARDVAPRSYLPHSMPTSSFLAGGQRIDAEMGFVDPGANAVGFEIDACLPARGGGVACANDVGMR